MKQFKNEEEYQKALNSIRWKASMHIEHWTDEMKKRIGEAEMLHSTGSLKDAMFLLKLFQEKVEEHNARCKQKAGQMEQISYKRNNIEGF
jgi:hypothetical protein